MHYRIPDMLGKRKTSLGRVILFPPIEMPSTCEVPVTVVTFKSINNYGLNTV